MLAGEDLVTHRNDQAADLVIEPASRVVCVCGGLFKIA